MRRKIRSLVLYIRIFRNWWVAALARYAGKMMGPECLVRLRDGRCFFMRPAFDYIALGEVFIVETYAACRAAPDVKTVWDIGSNIGLFVIWSSKFLPGASYQSFEPCASTFDILERNRSRNPRITWDLNPYGLSVRDEICEGHVPGGMYGSTSRHRKDGETVRLPMRNVEQVWREKGCPVIDLVKMDCEGDEYDIIETMPDAMLRNIRMILMEVHVVSGKDPEELKARLKKIGFRFTEKQSCPSILVARQS
jgi:FkbM family methyltransferase